MIVSDRQSVGRLYVSRWPEEIRVVDIALLPDFCNRGIGTTLLQRLQAEAQASGKPLRIHVELQRRIEALRAPRIPADRGQGCLSFHRMER